MIRGSACVGEGDKSSSEFQERATMRSFLPHTGNEASGKDNALRPRRATGPACTVMKRPLVDEEEALGRSRCPQWQGAPPSTRAASPCRPRLIVFSPGRGRPGVQRMHLSVLGLLSQPGQELRGGPGPQRAQAPAPTTLPARQALTWRPEGRRGGSAGTTPRYVPCSVSGGKACGARLEYLQQSW